MPPAPADWPLGVDISEAMLARAVRAQTGPGIGFLRADAQRLPLRDHTVDAIVSIAVILLVPDPVTALSEMARVLRPGGRLAVMVPTAGRAWRLMRLLPDTGAREFGDDELGDNSWRISDSPACGPKSPPSPSGCALNAEPALPRSLQQAHYRNRLAPPPASTESLIS